MALVILMGHQTPVGPLLTCSLSRMVFIEHLSHVGSVLGAGETTRNWGGINDFLYISGSCFVAWALNQAQSLQTHSRNEAIPLLLVFILYPQSSNLAGQSRSYYAPKSNLMLPLFYSLVKGTIICLIV